MEHNVGTCLSVVTEGGTRWEVTRKKKNGLQNVPQWSTNSEYLKRTTPNQSTQNIEEISV